jgi:hypothetical protein
MPQRQRQHQRKIRLDDTELATLTAAALITNPTPGGCNLADAIRAAALEHAEATLGIIATRNLPLPDDNWYEAWSPDGDLLNTDELATLPTWGCAPPSPFHLIDNPGSDGPRWIPVSMI